MATSSPPLKSGLVTVRGEIRHVWRSRTFSLRDDCLLYWSGDSAAGAVGAVGGKGGGGGESVRHVTILHCRPYTQDEQIVKKSSLPSGTFGFVIYGLHSGASRVYHCSVPSRAEMEEWVKLLRGVAIRGGKGWRPNGGDTTASVYNFQVSRRKNKDQKSGLLNWKTVQTLTVCVEYKINVVQLTGGHAGAWTVIKSFSDFTLLLSALKTEFSTPTQPFPKVLENVQDLHDKANSFFIVGGGGMVGIRKRIGVLNDILRVLVNDSKVGGSEKLREFLLPEDRVGGEGEGGTINGRSNPGRKNASRRRQTVAQFAKNMFLSNPEGDPNHQGDGGDSWVVLDSSTAETRYNDKVSLSPSLSLSFHHFGRSRTYPLRSTLTLRKHFVVPDACRCGCLSSLLTCCDLQHHDIAE